MRVSRMGLPLLAALLLSACAARQEPATVVTDIRVERGPTWIQDGAAQGAQDITVSTPHLAFAISADSGALVDLALAEQGRYGADRVRALDFVAGDGELQLRRLEVVEQTLERVVIELERDWQGQPLLSRYEVNRSDAGIRLSSNRPAAAGRALAGYRLRRNDTEMPAAPDYNDMPNLVQAHWTAASLHNEPGVLHQNDDLRRVRQSGDQGEYHAWLSAGPLAATDGKPPASDQGGLALLELTPASGEFEARLNELRRRWSRGERVYLGAGSGSLYAYTPKGKQSRDYAAAAVQGHSFLSFGPRVYPVTTNFGGTARPFSETQVEFRSDVGLARAEVWLDGKQVAGWTINGARWFRTGVPVPPNHTWMQWVVEDRQGQRAYSNPIWIE